jgi:hypothetical protein
VREYERAHRVLGLSLPELWQVNVHALRVAFLHQQENLRAQLIAEFEAFAATEPALTGR